VTSKPGFCHSTVVGLAGSEPRTLFNVIQFVMNDRDRRSQVSLEEAMQIIYLRCVVSFFFS
jgi:hypothetical protein